MKPSELFDLAREVYRYINTNPMVSRGILNTQFRTSSDDRRNRQLTEAIDSLLARLYVYKYTDEGTTQTFFWSSTFMESPYEPDDEPTLDYTPIDIFGARPVDETPPPPPSPAPTVTVTKPEVDRPEHPRLDESSPEYKAMQKMLERVGGKLKPVYERMMQEPLRIFGKADEEFSFLGDHVQRAMMLGRMFGLGYIRRFKDSKDPKVSYYTIFGECPASLVEDSVELGKAAQKRQKAAKEAQERKELIDRVTEGLQQKKEPQEPVEGTTEEEETVTTETEEVEEAVEETVEDDSTNPPPEEEEEEEVEQVEPACYVSNTGEIFIRRKDNTSVDLDVEESAAVLEVFRMMNPIVLDQLVERVKAKKDKQ